MTIPWGRGIGGATKQGHAKAVAHGGQTGELSISIDGSVSGTGRKPSVA